MKLKSMRYPLVKFPSDTQIALYLIKEELKTRRFFQILHRVGLDDCYFRAHLDSLIMHNLGMDDDTDETFMIYNDIMEKRSRRIEADNDSVMKQALKVYMELKKIRKELQGKEE